MTATLEHHRAILHLDLDAFFAAVEVLENSAFRRRWCC